MAELIDIFPPPTPELTGAGAGLLSAWPVLVITLVVIALVVAGLWRRRLALRRWWLARLLARGRCAPREAARRGLLLLRRARRPAIPASFEAVRRGLDAGCYGREPPERKRVLEALNRMRPWL